VTDKIESQPDDLNAPQAYVNAAEMLAIARKYALERKDPHSMVEIANSWIQIGHHLLTAEIELVFDDEDNIKVGAGSDAPFTMGFLGDLSGEEEVESSPLAEPN